MTGNKINTILPRVSVIMPVYNAEQYIRESIASLQAQTFENWELIVIDDQSKDSSLKIVKEMAATDKRIRILRNSKNSGAAKSRNNGIARARGEFVALLDSDDLWYPEKLEKQLALADSTDADILYCSYGMVDGEGVKRWKDYVVPETVTVEDMLISNLIGCLTVMVRRELLQKYPFPLEYYHEDYANWMRLLKAGYNARGLSEVLASYRVHANSKASNKAKVAVERYKIYRKMLKLSPMKSLYYLSRYMVLGVVKYKKSGEDESREKKKSRKVAIIGHFGGDETFLDGQTIKTRILYEELQDKTSWTLIPVDTYLKKKHPFRLLTKSLLSILKADSVITMVHENGMKLYFPILYLAAKLLKREVYQDVIGGDLPVFVKRYPKYVKYLNSFQSNWVETGKLKSELESLGIQNCLLLPNFKRLPLVEESDLEKSLAENSVLSFCTFSRVIKEKGIETAVEAVKEINAAAGKSVCTLTIYGQVGNEYKIHFEKLWT